MKIKRPIFGSVVLSETSFCGAGGRNTVSVGSGGKDGRGRVIRMSLLFGGYLMIVTIASIGVAFCLGSILLTESVILRWSLHGVS